MPLLFLSLLSACAARHMPDWSRVQAVSPKTKTEAQLYKDKASKGSRKIKGRFDSATDGSITLRLKDGQTRTLEKSDVRKVLTRRPFAKRWPGWVALGTPFVLEKIATSARGIAPDRTVCVFWFSRCLQSPSSSCRRWEGDATINRVGDVIGIHDAWG